MASRWQKTLEESWNYKKVIILCGNIRDLYLYEDTEINRYELLDLKDFLTKWVGQQVNRFFIYDPVDKLTDLSIISNNNSKKTLAESGTIETQAATRFEQQSSADDIKAPVSRDLIQMSHTLTTIPNCCYVIQFADNITTEKPVTPEEKQIIITLEKLFHDINPRSKLILLFLTPEQIPEELVKNEPNCRVIEIPPPDRTDIKNLFISFYKIDEEKVGPLVNYCYGLSFTEIQGIVEKLPEDFKINELNKAVRRYKFGDVPNYWAELSLYKLKNVKKYFKEIKGQDNAIEKVIDVLVRARSDIQKKTGGNPGRPKGALFFAGPTGVGKTETAKKLAGFLFDNENNCLRFDMSEYRQEFQVSRLYGAPPGYIGYERGGTLTNPVQNNPFCVILFDEFEKAHPRVFDIFLQILSDGRLTDSKGNTTFFSEAIIIFTSNLGTRTKDYNDNPIPEKKELSKAYESNDSEKIREHFRQAVEGFFKVEISRPELLNRVGRNNIVVFDYINSDEVIIELIKEHLNKVQDEFNKSYSENEQKLTLKLPNHKLAASLFIINKERIKEYGGREVENIINEQIRDKLAWHVLTAEDKNIKDGSITAVLGENGEFDLKSSWS